MFQVDSADIADVVQVDNVTAGVVQADVEMNVEPASPNVDGAVGSDVVSFGIINAAPATETGAAVALNADSNSSNADDPVAITSFFPKLRRIPL